MVTSMPKMLQKPRKHSSKHENVRKSRTVLLTLDVMADRSGEYTCCDTLTEIQRTIQK